MNWIPGTMTASYWLWAFIALRVIFCGDGLNIKQPERKDIRKMSINIFEKYLKVFDPMELGNFWLQLLFEFLIYIFHFTLKDSSPLAVYVIVLAC